jgi:cobalamin transport system permease protein
MSTNKVEPSLYSKRSSQWKLIIVLLIFALIAVIILSLNIGYAQISFSEILAIIGKNVPFIGKSISSASISPTDQAIIMQIRLPRVLAAALVGAALASAGVLYQGVFKNPMADSYLLGASAGASLGYTIAVLYVGSFVLLVGQSVLELFAFVFAVITVFLVYFMSRVGSKVPVTTLLLSGIVVNLFLLAMETVLELRSGQALTGIVAWLAGGFSDIVWLNVWEILPIVIFTVVVAYFFARDLNVLSLGDDTAQHLGVNTERTRQILLILGSLVTAAAVAISGIIGFVGLIVPHMTRLIIGPDHRILLPSSTIVGAIFLVACDSVARVATGVSELPVGVITALLGTPFFIYLLRKKKTSYSL